MKTKRRSKHIAFWISSITVIALCLSPLGSHHNASAQDIPEDNPIVETTYEVVNDYYALQHLTFEDGTKLSGHVISGPSAPPKGYQAEGVPSTQIKDSRTITADFPSYSWFFGCSAVSGAMIAGYYDRNGFPNIYTGPTEDGIMPLSDTAWLSWTDESGLTYPNNPLIATHMGVDGLGTKGSIDDYWVEYISPADDPYITGSWTQHTWGTAIGDYMKTSQSIYDNPDGSTRFYSYTDGTKLTCGQMESYDYINSKDGTYGRKLFYEARGYTVTDCYSQYTDNQTSGGFSLADYQAQIDAGHPVLLNLYGHSIVGFGYSETSSTIYIRDTWDNDPNTIYTMTWGGSYGGMNLVSASIVNLSKISPTPISPSGSIDAPSPTYQWGEVTDATQYQVNLYYADTTTIVYSKEISEPSCTDSVCSAAFTDELAAGFYEWMVRGFVDGAYGPWSSIEKFHYFDPALNKYFPLVVN
ncbi:MAG: hypothetical protein SVT56_07935 [Chloroflexota bacterium]|nr:hypothetical protein [Chloroflexota bacterium]